MFMLRVYRYFSVQYFPPVPPDPSAATKMRRPTSLRRRTFRGVAIAVAATVGVSLSGASVEAAPSGAALAAPLPQSVVGLLHGSTGPAVTALQEALIAAGISVPGGADGIFGPATEKAVAEFQRRNGLYINGRVDEKTAAKLGTASGGAAPSASAASAGSSSGLVGLTVGSRGDAVRTVQKALMDAGIYVPGGVDGVYGPATKSAVSNYQRWNGLTVTGTVTQAVVKALGLTGSSGSGGSSTPAPARSSTGNALVGLKIGATGDKVRALQQGLLAAGIDVYGGADGLFGPATHRALVAYQKANGLTANGVVDDATAAKLSSAASSAPPASSSQNWVGMTVGARGDRVKQLQRALLDTGLTVRGGADGIFGPATKAALVAFQSVNGIPQTGVLTAQGAQILGLAGSGGGAVSGIVTPTGYPKFGEHSSRVASMQRALMNAGITVRGGADGKFGSATAAAIMDFQRRKGISVSGVMNETTARQLGISASAAPSAPSAAGITLKAFPVQARCYFGDTWHAPRGGGRTHLGVDIIAKQGNEIYAVVDGVIGDVVRDKPGSRSGNGFKLRQPNGTYFSYYHLHSFATGIGAGVPVKAGQVIGYVGSTGNSATPHLHLEIHPGGGAAINPYPLVKAIDAC